MGDRVERPAESSGADVVGADVARGSGKGFGTAAANDEEVFVDDAGTRECDGLALRVAAEVFAKVDAAIVAEGWDGFAGGRIEGIDEAHDSGEDVTFAAVDPPGKAADGTA